VRGELVRILEEKKVDEISVYDMRMKSALFDYFIVGTVSSSKQVYAIFDEIKKSDIEVHHIEETSDGGWTLIDCFDTIIHLFTKKKREEYDLDSLWKETEKKRENGLK